MLRKISKAIGALLGGLTGAGVVAVFGMFGKDVDPGTAAAIALLGSTVGAWLAPRNATT